MRRHAHGSNTKQQGHPLDHPEISAGWLSRLFYRWTGPLLRKGLTQPQVSLDDLYPLLPEDRRDGRADAFLALTARQPVRPWPLTAFIWRHYKGRIGLLTLLQLPGHATHHAPSQLPVYATHPAQRGDHHPVRQHRHCQVGAWCCGCPPSRGSWTGSGACCTCPPAPGWTI